MGKHHFFGAKTVRPSTLSPSITCEVLGWLPRWTRVAYNADGSTSATVQVSNIDDQAVNDATVIYDQASQVNSINRAAG